MFSAPMVRAILEGRKTQTRRIIKPQPPAELLVGRTLGPIYGTDLWAIWSTYGTAKAAQGNQTLKCPYGAEPHEEKVSRLWVRETWKGAKWPDWSVAIEYKAGGTYTPPKDTHFTTLGRLNAWTPSIHMPRWASRIDLEVVKVRVERLQDISEEDAKAEGVQGGYPTMLDWANHFKEPQIAKDMVSRGGKTNAWYCYRKLWTEINGAESWDANPWVWVIEFKRIRP